MNVIYPYPIVMDQIMVLAMGFPMCLVLGLYVVDAIKFILREIF